MKRGDVRASAPAPVVRLGRRLKPAAQAGNRMVRNDGLEIAASMAFSTLLALFPFLIFLIAFAAFFHVEDEAREAVAIALGAVPDQVARVIAQPFGEALSVQSPELLTIGGLLALWSASNGVETLRIGLNRAYAAEERRSVVRRRGESLIVVAAAVVLAVVLGWLTIVAAVLRASLPEFAQATAGFIIDNPLTRYLLAGGALLAALCLAHFWLPGGGRRLRDVLPGALFTTVSWLALAAGFSVYLANFNSYDVVYGGLGGVVAAMMFFYFTAMLVLFGAELNHALMRRAGPRALGAHGCNQ